MDRIDGAQARRDPGCGGRRLQPTHDGRRGENPRAALRQDFIEPKIAEHHGRVAKLMGDGALVEFARAWCARRLATARITKENSHVHTIVIAHPA